MKLGLPIFAILILAASSLCSGSAAAPPTEVDPAFLQSLATSATSGPQSLVDIPQAQNLDTICTISKDCGDGNTKSCTGTYACTTTPLGVSCNGEEHKCPNACTASASCDQCNSVVTCFSTTGPCTVTDTGVSCGSHQFVSCPRFC